MATPASPSKHREAAAPALKPHHPPNGQGATSPRPGATSPRPGNKGSGGKLLDKYKLGKQVGQGAFGVVYKCRKRGTEEEFAVKMIDQVETPLAEIQREVDMLFKMAHPCIVKIHDVFYEKCFVCIVMQFYKGGDMIQGMMEHWNTKGMIPMAAVRRLTKQMWESIAFMHSRNCAHRDVKGDNFMMDIADVTAPDNRIYLNDFGTVVELRAGERFTTKCGTKNYWSPEFYKLNYGLKVDCWAVGVVMFGLFSAKFPFKNQDEVKTKKLVISSRVDKPGVDLVNAALDRNEDTRMEAKYAVSHAFIADIAGFGGSAPEEIEKVVDSDLKETGANAGVKERRRELVDRLTRAHVGKPNAKQEPEQQEHVIGWTWKQIDAHTFAIIDAEHERSIKYSWWQPEKVEELQLPFFKVRPMSATSRNDEVDHQTVGKILADHSIPLDKFGRGQAKPFNVFVSEIQNGQSRLLIDATKYKHLVRVVDVVLLRIVVQIGAEKRYLIETSETYPDGRARMGTNQLPGNKKHPYENARQAAERMSRELLNMPDCGINFTMEEIDHVEQSVESPSYPGVQTVYKKEILTGVVTAKDRKILERIGALGPGAGFTIRDLHKYTRTYAWYTESECESKSIQLKVPREQGKFSALVYPPIGLEEEELNDFMAQNKVDVSKWGQGTYRSIAEFSEELVKGEATLIKGSDGQIVRVVDIVVLKLVGDGGRVLVEVEENRKDVTQARKRFPAIKRRSDEHQFAAARRLISKSLLMDENSVTIDNTLVRIVEELQESTSYHGIKTLYRKRFMTAKLHEAAKPSA